MWAVRWRTPGREIRKTGANDQAGGTSAQNAGASNWNPGATKLKMNVGRPLADAVQAPASGRPTG
jgi:hypothetical protein